MLFGPPQLLGLRDASSIDTAITGLLLRSPKPSSTNLSDFLKPFAAGDERNGAAQALIARGVDPKMVSSALSWLETSEKFNFSTMWGVLATVSMVASVYHGYKRNQSIPWAIGWGVMAVLLPAVTPAIAVAQGFGKRKVA